MTQNRIPEPNQPKHRPRDIPLVETIHLREHAILAEYLGAVESYNRAGEDF